jgi:hypothetical protein
VASSRNRKNGPGGGLGVSALERWWRDESGWGVATLVTPFVALYVVGEILLDLLSGWALRTPGWLEWRDGEDPTRVMYRCRGRRVSDKQLSGSRRWPALPPGCAADSTPPPRPRLRLVGTTEGRRVGPPPEGRRRSALRAPP